MIVVIAGVLLGLAAGLYGLHRLAVYLERRGLIHYLKSPPRGGAGYNPLQEFVEPRARHVVQVEEQRVVGENAGGPPAAGGKEEPEAPGKG